MCGASPRQMSCPARGRLECRRLCCALALVAQRIEHLTTDQKVGGSSPSERAQVNGPFRVQGRAFCVPPGATPGATGAISHRKVPGSSARRLTGSTKPAAKSRPPNWRPPTTVRTPPSPRPVTHQTESPETPARFKKTCRSHDGRQRTGSACGHFGWSAAHAQESLPANPWCAATNGGPRASGCVSALNAMHAGSGAPPAASRPRPRPGQPNTVPQRRRGHRRP